MNFSSLVISLLCVLLVHSTSFTTVGSCQKFTHDGLKCQKCVSHYHLHEGLCYIDILGCSSYRFGNICHSCENGYILVNNLCCDHNCLAKLFKRHDSKKPTKIINQNFEIFNKIIPFLNEHYIKGKVNNLVQIQQRTYIDAIRYVILYEFPAGKFRMMRAIVDFVKQSSDIVVVDWSEIEEISQFMEFRTEQINLENDYKLSKVLEKNFQSKPKVEHARKYKFTEIEQYEVAYKNDEKEKIEYQTFYNRIQKKILLVHEQKDMPAFLPSSKRVEFKDFELEFNSDNNFYLAVNKIKSDARFKPQFVHALIKEMSRYLREYIFYIQNDSQWIEFFLIEDRKNNVIISVDYFRKEKPSNTNNPILQNLDLQNILKGEEKAKDLSKQKLSSSETKIIQIIQQAVKSVIKDQNEEKRISECKQVNCENRNAPTLPIEGEQVEIVELFRQRNPSFTSFDLVQIWSHKFKTFVQWTLLIRLKQTEGTESVFFHVIEYLNPKSFVFWGQNIVKSVATNEKGEYLLPNKQENVPESEVAVARTEITKKFPDTQALQLRKSMARSFPETRQRFVIVLRHKTSEIRYIVLKDETKAWVQQWETISENLEEVTQQKVNQIDFLHKLQIVADKVETKHEINKQIDQLNNEAPIKILVDKKELHPTIKQDYQQKFVINSAIKGKSVQNIRNLDKSTEEVIMKVKKLIPSSVQNMGASFTSISPLAIIEQTFCQHTDIILIYQIERKIYSFSFRLFFQTKDTIQYLGFSSFILEANTSDRQIVNRALSVRVNFNSESAKSFILSRNEAYKGLCPLEEQFIQLGNRVRANYLFEMNGYLKRFILQTTESGDFDIIEECRLDKQKETLTETKISLSGQKLTVTNDVQKLVKTDEVVKKVIQNVKNQVKEVKTSAPETVKIVQYENKTEISINFQKRQNKQPKYEVLVIHDKQSQNNEIISVDKLADKKKQAPDHIKQVEFIQKQVQHQQNFVEVWSSEKEKQKNEIPKQVEQVVTKVNQMLVDSQNISKNDIVVKEILLREEEDKNKNIQKIQHIVQNSQSGQQLLVTTITNKQTNKIVIEQVKPVEEPLLDQIKKDKQTAKQEQFVYVKPAEVQKILIEVEEKLQKQETKQIKECLLIADQISRKESQSKSKDSSTIVISPRQIEKVVESIKNELQEKKPNEQKIQIFIPTVTQKKEQVISFIQSIKPETSDAKVVSSVTQILPNSVITHLIQNTPKQVIYQTVTTTEKGKQLTQYEKVLNNKEQTIQSIITILEKEDVAAYKPVDPNIVSMTKANLIISSQTNSQFERKVDISNPQQKVEQVIQAIRSQYPVTEQATVLSATESKTSSTTSQVKVDFFIPKEDKKYIVDQAKIQINTANSDPTYTVTSFKEVIDNGHQTNILLQKTDPSQLPNIINAAYGYVKLDLGTAGKDPDIQLIQLQIQKRYPQFVSSQSVTEIQVLELKNGKVNYIFRYKTVYFTIYWDSVLKRIIFLNEVSSASRNEFTAVKSTQYFSNGLQYMVQLHPNEMKNYKMIWSGQYTEGVNIIFQVQFLSGTKKYRCVFQINKQNMDILQILFTELIQIRLKDNSLKNVKILTEQYQKIEALNYKTNRYLIMVDQYSRNRNQLLINAKILGVSFKPQNLGFSFKITYTLVDSKLIEVVVYIETFSQRIYQNSIKNLDFQNDFSPAEAPTNTLDKLAKAIASKASIILVPDQYSISNVQAKEFLFGDLFKLTITFNSADYEGLAYLDTHSGSVNLITWRLKTLGDGCESKSEDGLSCKKCYTGFIESSDRKSCLREIIGCQVYGQDNIECKVCKTGYQIINSLCTKDCGQLCKTTAFP